MDASLLLLLMMVVVFLLVCGLAAGLVVWLVLRSRGGPRGGA
jgi:hypothetical protein